MKIHLFQKKKSKKDNQNEEIVESKVEAKSDSGNEGVKASQPETLIDDNTEVYKIQFLTSTKKLKDGAPELKGLSPVNYYYEKGIYTYTFGTLTDKKEALSLQNKIRKKFKGAFIVVFKGEKRIR